MKKSFSVLLLLSLSFFGCSKIEEIDNSEIPILYTLTISDITYNSAKSGGINIQDNGSSISQKGVCWSISHNPTVQDNKTIDGSNTDNFSSTLADLNEETTYYVRAYARNEKGVGYGEEESFTTGSSTFIIPCSPINNSIIFNSQNHTFNNVYATGTGVLYGEYEIEGTGSMSDLRIGFSQAPATGIYTTKGPTSFIGNNECVVSGTFSNYHYVASSNASVYVTKIGIGQYTASFCNLNFSSGSIFYTFNSNGNLTTN
jgi:hypothetical protein